MIIQKFDSFELNEISDLRFLFDNTVKYVQKIVKSTRKYLPSNKRKIEIKVDFKGKK